MATNMKAKETQTLTKVKVELGSQEQAMSRNQANDRKGTVKCH